MTSQPHRDVHRMALVIVVACNLLAYWYPFKPDFPRRVENSARRTPDGAVEVDSSSRVLIALPARLAASRTSGTWAVALEAYPARPGQTGPARLVDAAGDPYRPGFALALDGRDFVVRMPCRGGDTGAEWRFPVEYGPGGVVAVTVRQAGHGARPELVFRGGSAAVLDARCAAGDLVSPFVPDRPWSIGNVASGHRPFEGRIGRLMLAADGMAVDLLRDGDPEVPAAFWLLPERYFQTGRDDASELLAAVWHVAGFFALGGLLASGPHRMRSVTAFLAAMGLAAVLNGGKLVVAGRHTDAEDLLLNAAGAALGILSAHLALGARTRSKRVPR